MARTAVAITELTQEAATALVLSTVGAAIDATNSHKITPTAGIDPRELILFVENTTGSTKTATVNVGDRPPAMQQGAAVVASLTDGSTTPTMVLVPLSSRFIQSDGTIEVDIAASMTGRIACFHLPRSK